MNGEPGAPPMASPTFGGVLARFDRLDLRHLALTGILCTMFGGAFPALVTMFGHGADLAMWFSLWGLLATFWAELPLRRLLAPAAPMILWMVFYVVWGTMAADYPIFDEAYRLGLRFLTVAAAMAVVTSRPGRLRVFANAVQLMLVVNLAVTLLLMNRPGYQEMPMFAQLNVEVESDRFAGLWGNANVAGLVSLMALALSAWASPALARIGRACGLAIIYLTASRTATWILVGLTAGLPGLPGPPPRVRPNALIAALVLAVCGVFFALKCTGACVDQAVADSPDHLAGAGLPPNPRRQAGRAPSRCVHGRVLAIPADPGTATASTPCTGANPPNGAAFSGSGWWAPQPLRGDLPGRGHGGAGLFLA